MRNMKLLRNVPVAQKTLRIRQNVRKKNRFVLKIRSDNERGNQRDMGEMTFEEFSHAVNSIYKKNCGVYYRLASYYGFTETMFDILYFIRENEGSYTQAQLCSTLCLRKQTVNTALKKLEKDGYIYFAKDTENKKNKTIHFTEKGESLAKDTVDHIFEVEKQAFEGLTEEEREGVLYYGLKHIEVLEEKTEKFLKSDKKKRMPE